jgi:hypothetical protein
LTTEGRAVLVAQLAQWRGFVEAMGAITEAERA